MALTFAELRAANESRCAQWRGLSDWSVMEWACAMAGEAGEACNVAKKIKRIETGIAKNPVEIGADLVPDLAEECADVMIYLDLLCASRGIDLASAVIAKFNAVSDRYDFPQRLNASATEQASGWRFVPVEPTKEMLTAAHDWSNALYGKPIGNAAAYGCFKAMIEAAAPPHPHGDGG